MKNITFILTILEKTLPRNQKIKNWYIQACGTSKIAKTIVLAALVNQFKFFLLIG